jgi:glycosyltransferase involved in cell wall biosynthesis
MMATIKLLFIVEDFKIGGLERLVETLFIGLNRNKYRPTIFCIAHGGEIAEKLIQKGEDIRILGLTNYHNPLNIIKLAVLIRSEKYQIVHCHGYFASTMGRIAAFLAGVPVIISHVHTTDWNLSKRNMWIEKVLSKITDRIICCSEAVKQFVVSNEKIDQKKTITIYNGVNDLQPSGIINTDIESEENIFRIIVVASLVHNKGHRYLLEAVSKIVKKNKKVRLIIVGDGVLKEELTSYAKSIGIGDYTEFTGLVTNVGEIFKKSNIGVLPSIEREGLGISLIEAMCCGLPVVGTNIGGITEVIQDNINGFIVPPKDAGVIERKLSVLIDNRIKRISMGNESRKLFEKKFDARIMLSQVDNLYNSLLKDDKT